MGDEELKNDFASSVNVLNNNLFVVHDILKLLIYLLSNSYLYIV